MSSASASLKKSSPKCNSFKPTFNFTNQIRFSKMAIFGQISHLCLGLRWRHDVPATSPRSPMLLFGPWRGSKEERKFRIRQAAKNHRLQRPLRTVVERGSLHSHDRLPSTKVHSQSSPLASSGLWFCSKYHRHFHHLFSLSYLPSLKSRVTAWKGKGCPRLSVLGQHIAFIISSQ